MMTSGKQQLTLKVTQQGDAAVVKLAGAVSLSEAEALRDRLEKLAGQRHPVIVLDLSEMDFICSLGLGAII